MERDLVVELDKKDDCVRNEAAEVDNPIMDVNDISNQSSDVTKLMEVNVLPSMEKQDIGNDTNTIGEVNMEASITADDIMRAGGFGATDDINSFLPVAMDLTDFEASLRDARDYEEPQGEISRPGLGWTEDVKSEDSWLTYSGFL